jgi:hypothetical protein
MEGQWLVSIATEQRKETAPAGGPGTAPDVEYEPASLRTVPPREPFPGPPVPNDTGGLHRPDPSQRRQHYSAWWRCCVSGRCSIPGNLEIGAGIVESSGCASTVLAWPGAGVKSAISAPLVHINGDATEARNRADMHIAIIDMPSVLALRISATGQVRHGPLKRRWGWRGSRWIWGLRGMRAP